MGKGIILGILLIGMVGIYAACKKETQKLTQKELLINKWNVDEWIVAPSMNLPDSVVQKMIQSATMEFKADSTFIFMGMNPTPTTGTYFITDDAQLLTLLPKGANDSYGHSIKQLTKDTLVLVDPTGNKLVCSH